MTEWDVDISEKRQNDGRQHPFQHVMHAAPSDTGGVPRCSNPRDETKNRTLNSTRHSESIAYWASGRQTYCDARKTVRQNERPHQAVEHAW